jgi:hypothetical protein
MGMSSASVQPGTQPQGKGFAQPVSPQQDNQLDQINVQPSQLQAQQGQRIGKGSRTTNAATSGQPQMGQPNMYPNTVGQWDNASIQSQQPLNRGGKGKG